MATNSDQAYGLKAASRISGISQRRLLNWARTGLVRPSVVHQFSPRNTIRLYGFQDLLQVLVIANLLDRRIGLRHIRRVLDYLSGEYEEPLRQVTFAVSGQKVFFQHPDGSWEGEARPGQLLHHTVLELEPLRTRIDRASRRSDEQVGRIIQRRKVHSFAPIFDGTRIPVRAVQAYLKRGYPTREILTAYPDLAVEDVEIARSLTA